MKALKHNAIAMVIAALIFVPLSPSSARADDDDWEDRWEEYEDDLEDRWEDEEESLEELRERGFIRGRGWHRYYEPRGYRFYDEPGVRHYQYYDGPAYRYYYPERRRVYRYYEPYPPVYRYHDREYDDDRHGSVRVGPLYFAW